MWKELEKIFIKTGLDYHRQGSITEGKRWSKSFWTFWNMTSSLSGFFDNDYNRMITVWNVYYYTSDPATIYDAVRSFMDLAKEAGFVINTAPIDVPSGRDDYFGRMLTISYIEQK